MRFASVLSFVLGLVLLTATFACAQTSNKLLSVQSQGTAEGPAVTLKTQAPVGYRYTVYDSFDPVRVVVDFPGMDVSQVKDSLKLTEPNLKEVRISSFDLESGVLGRVEIVLEKTAGYEVSLAGNEFKIAFKPVKGQVASIGKTLTTEKKTAKPAAAKAVTQPAPSAKPAKPAPAAKAPVAKATAAKPVTKKTTAPAKASPAPKQAASSSAAGISFAGPKGQQARFLAPAMQRFQYFRLAGPSRLVVDLYGVKPDFRQRSFAASDGFKRIRVGAYADKTRFVFDAEGDGLPGFEVAKDGDAVVVDWSGKALVAGKSGKPVVAVKPSAKGVPVAIEALDFDSKGGASVFTIRMSGPGKLLPAVQKDDTVQFGIANATINRSLRRVVDASSFPSSVKLITPYIVQGPGGQEVRFAVALKGPVPFSLKQSGNKVLFQTEDGAFAEVAPPSPEKVAVTMEPGQTGAAPSGEVAATVAAVEQAPAAASSAPEAVMPSSRSTLIAEEETRYTGEKISLVFENADIRQILQLIGEVANLNIIASDEVRGNVTLRLLDVPWDQALDLVMDIKDLGMLRDGNVARILPRARIRAMEEAKLTAKRTKEKLEDLVTEVIMVSHASLDKVAAPASELLTERGKITQDARNKQLIVTDVPSAIASVRQLIEILDTPERQVLIESRIVEANSNFSRDLGVKWGVSYDQRKGANDNSGRGFANLDNGQLGLGGSFLIDPSNVVASTTSGLGSSFTFGRVGFDSTVLDLKISALETSGHGKVISQPRVATLNGESAMISQGTKIPYQSVSDAGTETKFENAELKLEVTPVINPDDSVILEILASNSSVGATVPTGVGDAIAIDEKKAETKVLVRDGETTVIGGIFVEDDRFSESGVPVLMKLPVIGNLFKSTTKTNERRELLIFITPRILK